MSKTIKAQPHFYASALRLFGSAKKTSAAGAARRLGVEFERLRNDTSGNFALTFALASPILLGAAGLGLDVGRWELAHKSLQRAADSAAVSAAIAYQANVAADLTAQATAVAASYSFTSSNGSTVTVNRPPLSGSNNTNNNAVEVIVSQPQARMFSSLFGQGAVPESGRAVAVAGAKVCVLALDPTASSGVSAQGSVNVSAVNCSIYSDSNSSNSVSAGGAATLSALQIGAVGTVTGQTNMTTTNGIVNYGRSIPDPYAGTAVPTFNGCNSNNFSEKGTVTISPGVYCNGFSLNAGANVTLLPGIYYIDRGTFSINGSTTLSGAGVTIIFTSSTGSNYATAKINGGAVLNLTAPTSGPTAGLVMFGDPAMPVGTNFSLAGGASQTLRGATYFPKGSVSFAGGGSSNSGCSVLIADTISFVGSSSLAIQCNGTGTKEIGRAAQIME